MNRVGRSGPTRNDGSGRATRTSSDRAVSFSDKRSAAGLLPMIVVGEIPVAVDSPAPRRVLCDHGRSSHGFITSIPVLVKSFTFLVANAAWWVQHMETICASKRRACRPRGHEAPSPATAPRAGALAHGRANLDARGRVASTEPLPSHFATATGALAASA
jgi:hypothetical protein